MLSPYKTAYPNDTFLEELVTNIKEEKVLHHSDFVALFRPKSQIITRDSLAAHGGLPIPPHIHVLAEVGAWKVPFNCCSALAKYARRAGSHLAVLQKGTKRAMRTGTHVFIGHGASPVWKDFRDFIRDRLKLPWDEFNRVPVAGVPTITRLLKMLDDAAIAFLIMTAEDEQPDGKLRARMNVIHEAGLFQGRLGFERAIILLEDGCEEFGNVHGLGQIRFPKGNIAQAFEEVRRVLEREDLIAPVN
jgi:predicted nucleotide-binding protein